MQAITNKQKWKLCSAHGELFNKFITKQRELHPEFKKSISAMNVEMWFKLIDVKSRFSEMSDLQINRIYAKANWLCECDYIQIFQCDNCGLITYYCNEEDLMEDKVGLGYWGMAIEKNVCHTLETKQQCGYGSQFDMEILKLDLCERCYCKFKKIKVEA